MRIIGLVVVAGGRALDVALVETDGGDIVRRIELERIVLGPIGIEDGVCAAVLAFIGDRALQPFAIDCVALGGGTSEQVIAALRRRLDVCAMIVNPEQNWPHLPLAERVALAAVPQFEAENSSGSICGCANTAD